MINTTETYNKMPYYECPSFDKCSAPLCPLDPNIAKRVALCGEEKCRGEKPTRVRIGSKYPELLKYQGLTRKEWLGKQMWDKLSTEEKTLRTQALAKSQKAIKPVLEG